ncbi:hypothetical protein [Planotetraspora mira]|jgi:hypothetical protein|uniref:Uncharacterized protein n=1 Tax=Planotetraspora mira TaxID=58121 RepID=A0A8J3TQG5_9ACTN|nr:hypothetical protein [Planotetraspora mira]GII30311.1 hypothetical protein Pmi06nite_37530 [Planotetraspora mira]
MYSPSCGYDPDGSEYSPTFRRDYLQAQAERIQRLTKSAQGSLCEPRLIVLSARHLFCDGDALCMADADQIRARPRNRLLHRI